MQSTSSPSNADNEEDLVCAELGHEIGDAMALDKLNPVTEFEIKPENAPQVFPLSLPPYIPQEEIEFNQDGLEELHANICEDLEAGSPHESSNGCMANQHTEDSFMLQNINCGASQVHSWQFINDEFSNCMHGSMNSSECISQTLVNPHKAVSFPKGEKVNNLHLQELQKCNDTKLGSLDLGTDDLHYTRTLSAIFMKSPRLIVAPLFHGGNHTSSFNNWTEGGQGNVPKAQLGTPQKIVKKILFEVAWMHGGSLRKSPEENSSKGGLWKPEGDEVGVNHVLSERRRREKLKEKFHVLRSLVPSISKVFELPFLGSSVKVLVGNSNGFRQASYL